MFFIAPPLDEPLSLIKYYAYIDGRWREIVLRWICRSIEVIQLSREKAQLGYGGQNRPDNAQGLRMKEEHRAVLLTLLWKFPEADALCHLCRPNIRAIKN